MPIDPCLTIKDREYGKFDVNSDDEVVVRVLDQDLIDAITTLDGQSDTTVTIFNVVVATANLEVSQVLPANTKGFTVTARGCAKVQASYTSGQSGTNYFTIPLGGIYSDSNFYASQTLYFQTSIPDTIEIVAYVKA